MRCRSLYKKGNYNLTWFRSQGLKFPKYIIISIKKTGDSNDLEYKKIINLGSRVDFPVEYTNFTLGCATFSKILITKEEPIENSKMTIKVSSETDTFLIYIYIENNEGKTFEVYVSEEASKSYNLELPLKKWGCAIKVDDNYADKEEGTAYDLIQRLSVIKGELWYMINYGLPLLDKVKNKSIFDSVIINIVNKHPDVRNIISFESKVVGTTYTFNMKVDTIFNQTIDFSNQIG